eukprot:CAMPEP_0172583378 /NCGR_PEP_ID=MMETSP1068-20121228/3002_1 /TAXON_ID=35684 /ORGANISM="Pseudopedinella elastica, Strain CCMP716" /LENGTH=54 /DNA_ID=CAMNT_0013377143 /DNA_START=93 /DNA_END=257 /DNA_ORIENTATION=+
MTLHVAVFSTNWIVSLPVADTPALPLSTVAALKVRDHGVEYAAVLEELAEEVRA